ncbi:MAG TPA: hypothetical protein PJ990_06635 [Saprospiraceae bacterium]|nr:hypothetical protein [Saprospiraceae bacterium]
MKIKLYLIAFLIFSFSCNKEEVMKVEKDPNYVVLDGDIGKWHSSAILSADGNIIVVGSQIVDTSHYMIIHKTKPSGEIIYSEILPFENIRSMSVCEDSKQNIYIVGFTYSGITNMGRYIHVVKLDSMGKVLWGKSYLGLGRISPESIDVLNDNEIIISGSKSSSGSLILLKIDSLGEQIVFQDYDDDQIFYSPNDLLVLTDGNFLAVDSRNENFELTWFDRNFNFLFYKSYGIGHWHGRSAIQLDNGDVVIVGEQTYINSSGFIDSSKVKIIKIDSKGQLIWDKEGGNSRFSNDGQSIAVNQDGSFVVTGYGFELQKLNTEINHMLSFFDKDGNEINTRYFDDLETSRGQNILKTQDDRNVITGKHRDGTFFLNVDNFGN